MEQIPIVDLSLPEADNASVIHMALKDVGFLYVKNHGVPEALLAQLETSALSFFGLVATDKLEIEMCKSGKGWRGYFPVEGELTSGVPDLKEGIYFGVEHDQSHVEVVNGTPLHGSNQWPSVEMRNVVTEYMGLMNRLGQSLMRLTALGLGLNPSYFADRYGKEVTELFRIFNYPFNKMASSMGVHEHTDMGFLTILKQDVSGGLEVKSRDSDEWIAAPPIPGTFVINIGDMLELWTHGIYQATLHRVKNVSGKDRLSFPYFFDPSWHSKLTPIDRGLLRNEELESVPQATIRKWDGTDLRSLNQESTYGEFVWEKVRGVFPNLNDPRNSD